MTQTASFGKQKRIALISDLTGFGRCAIAVQLPLISALRVQCCPFPTVVLSNHPGVGSYFKSDLTEQMPGYAAEWKKHGLAFDAILTGFLSSARQIDYVKDFIADFRKEGTIVAVDPVMGDHGKQYSTVTDEICKKTRELAANADILTPNLTEACILTNTAYRADMPFDDIAEMSQKLIDGGAKKVIITGINQPMHVSNFCREAGRKPFVVTVRRAGEDRPGTGDVFSAIIAADAVNGKDLEESVRRSAGFISACIRKSAELNLPPSEGLAFEEMLQRLK